MTINIWQTFAAASIIYVLITFLIAAPARAEPALQSKSGTIALMSQTVLGRPSIREVPVNRSGKMVVATQGITMSGSASRYFPFSKLDSMAVCIFIALILGLGWNEYRKKRILIKKLEILTGNVKDQYACLQDVTREKERLVSELHHRVKNNLQVVVSLLDSQSNYLNHPEALQAVKSSQHRMYAISLVHQKLYQTDSLSFINMEAYISDLIQYLQDEYKSSQRIAVRLKTVPLSLNLAAAIPLGLIINEAVSNILQYAFPEHDQGEIKLTLAKEEQENYLLRIADNGIGLPAEFNMEAPGSLGTILMIGLSQQIHADLEIKNLNGVVITLRFNNSPLPSYPLSA